MSHHHTALSLVGEALGLLATDEHGIKVRLLAAYIQKLQYVKVADVPAELEPMLASILKRLGQKTHQTAQENAAAAEAALGRMSTPQATKLAKSIVEFSAVFAGSLYH